MSAQIVAPVKTPPARKVDEPEGGSAYTRTVAQEQTSSVSVPPVETKESRGASSSLPVQAPSTIPATSEARSSGESTNAGGVMVYNLYELPPSIQQNLPAFSITAHIHTGDPASGMVKVNGQTMREGQELSPGLRVEEIIPDGVIFRYQNYRFRVGLK
jgi:general secretion pathway protein B